MKKAELVEAIAEKVGVNKAQAESFLDAFESVIIGSLQKGSDVTITGFGTFMAKERSARMGVNPQNPSERIQIPAVTVPKFKAGKTLKDSLKQKPVAETVSDEEPVADEPEAPAMETTPEPETAPEEAPAPAPEPGESEE